MRVGMLVNNLDVSGGYQKLVLRLSEQLMQMGHDVTVYALSASDACYPELLTQVRVVTPAAHSEARPSWLERSHPPLQIAARFDRLAQLIDPKLDWLVVHDDYSLYGLARYAGRRTTHVSWMLNNQLSIGTGKLTEAVRAHRRSARRLLSALKSELLIRRGLAAVDDFAVYDSTNADLVQRVLGREATVVYAGADIDEFRTIASQRGRTRGGPLRLLSVGVIFPHRRYEDLIHAVSRLWGSGIETKATIVGLSRYSPQYAERLRTLATDLGLHDAIVFREFVETPEFPALYRDADAFVFVNDGFSWGISVFEAVAAAVPVVITANIGASELVQDGRHGWVVQPRDPEGLAAALEEIAADPGEARRRVQRAADEVLPTVSWEAYAQRMIALANRES